MNEATWEQKEVAQVGSELASEEEPLGRDELDAACDVLADDPSCEPQTGHPEAVEEPPGEEDPQAQPSSSTCAVEQRARSGSPGLPKRAEFPDLFKAPNGLPAVAGATAGVDDKILFLREKLKASECQIAAFREAWSTRESELDALEDLVMQERAHSAELADDLQTLREFIDKKKEEFLRYGEQVRAAFAEREAAERQLRRRLDEVTQANADRQMEVAARNGDIKKLTETVVRLRAKLADTQEEVDSLRAQLELRQSDLSRSRVRADEQQGELEVAKQSLKQQQQQAKRFKNALRAAKEESEETLRRLDAEVTENERLTMALRAERARMNKPRRRY